MPETRRRAQARIDELLRQSNVPSLTLIGSNVLEEAKRGIRDPASLTDLEIQRMCYAVIAYHSGPQIPK